MTTKWYCATFGKLKKPFIATITLMFINIAITANQNQIHTIAMRSLSTLFLGAQTHFHGPSGNLFQNFISPTVGKLFPKSDFKPL